MIERASTKAKIGMGSPPCGGSGMGCALLHTSGTMNEEVPR